MIYCDIPKVFQLNEQQHLLLVPLRADALAI